MPSQILDHRALEAYLPHRGINLMPDQVELFDGGTKSRSLTRIPPGDPRGREVFGRRDAEGRVCWYEPFLGELMALTGVSLLHERLAPSGQVAVFSSVSRVVIHGFAPLDAEVVVSTEITRDRGAFTIFSTWAECAGRRIVEAEVMSGVSTLAAILSAAAPAAGGAPAGEAIDPTALAWKPATMRLADRVVSADAASGRLVTAYTYPVDHPCVPGHFAGGPLMMGMMQWGAVADAAIIAARRFALGSTVVAQGVLRRIDGTEIVDIRDLSLTGCDGPAPRIAATKRIAFRGIVRPGEAVLAEVTVQAK